MPQELFKAIAVEWDEYEKEWRERKYGDFEPSFQNFMDFISNKYRE